MRNRLKILSTCPSPWGDDPFIVHRESGKSSIAPENYSSELGWAEEVQLLLSQAADRMLAVKVDAIEVEVKQLCVTLNRMERAYRFSSVILPIQTLAPEPYRLNKVLYATVLVEDDSAMACFIDANISESGDTIHAAITALKQKMLSVFDLLNRVNDDQLSAALRAQKVILNEFIVKE